WTEYPTNTHTIPAGQKHTIELRNGKTGMVDWEADARVFDIYYQWWEVDKNGKEIRLLAGTDNVYDESRGYSIALHTPEHWDIDKKTGESNDGHQYLNPINPLDPNATDYNQKTGLPNKPSEWQNWMYHMYGSHNTTKEEIHLWGGADDLSLLNNNIYANNSDTCYIPYDMAGKYLQVKAIVLNTRWKLAYDPKQTFKSHIVKVVDDRETLTIEPYVDYDYDAAMYVYATFDHPAKLRIGSKRTMKIVNKIETVDGRQAGSRPFYGTGDISFDLEEGEVIDKITYMLGNGMTKTFSNLNLTDPEKQPVALYPNDFYPKDTDLSKLNPLETKVSVDVSTKKGNASFRFAFPETQAELRYDVLGTSAERIGEETDTYRLDDILNGKFDEGVQIFAPVPANASIWNYQYDPLATLGSESGTRNTGDKYSSNPKVATLGEKGVIYFGGESGSTTITIVTSDDKKLTKTIRVLEGYNSFEMSGIQPPVVGQKFDDSIVIPENAPYHVSDIKWYQGDRELDADAIAEYYKPYTVCITLESNADKIASYQDAAYRLTAELPDGSFDSVDIAMDKTNYAWQDYDSTKKEYVQTFNFKYNYAAQTDHEAKTIDKIYMDFPT
ncbi:MAG: hypothetical protein J6P20_01015, partial [Oscillospiraceae bacterium]|nr:hypothetical protein [Oscillospiraceae bacterium]